MKAVSWGLLALACGLAVGWLVPWQSLGEMLPGAVQSGASQRAEPAPVVGRRDEGTSGVEGSGAPPAATIPATGPRIDAATASRLGLHARVGRGTLHDLAVQPGAGRLASATGASVRLYDAATRQALAVLQLDQPSRAVALSRDGATVAALGEDGQVRRWQGDDPAPLSGPPRSRGRVLALSPDGRQIVVGQPDGQILLWREADEAPAPEPRFTAGPATNAAAPPEAAPAPVTGPHDWTMAPGPHADAVTALAFSPDGGYLATASADGTVRLRSARDGAVLDEARFGNPVRAVAVGPGPGSSVTGGDGPESGARTGREQAASGGETATAAPTGVLVAAAVDETIRLWHVRAGGPPRVLRGHVAPVHRVDLASDGAHVLSGGEDGEVRLWQASDGAPIARANAGPAGVVGAAFQHLTEAGESIPSGDAGASLVTAHEDGSVRWWRADASSGTLAAVAVLDAADPAPAGLTFVGGTVALAASDGSVWLQDTASDGPARRIGRHGAAVRTIASAPGGWPLATGADDGTVRLWTSRDGGSRLFVGPTSAVRSVVLAPRHDLILAGASDGSIWRWLLRDGTRLPPLRDGASAVTALALAVDGQAVFAGRKDGSVRRHALDRTVAPTDLFSGQGATTGLLLAPLGADGRALVGGFAASPIQRSDLRTGGELGALAGPPATALATTPAGDVLASVSADGTLRLWQSADGRLLTELPAHTLPGVGVAFGPDGRLLATVGMDGTLALWTVR